ncbi:MAG: hypothetical protein CVU48_02600 [Candidatus Cloacimonetes bacterium HGW-Cloacimonetes-1]|nr:MAG: hypothetical protein CVU48_02600 [Candidatus Cloacimonetes bacterium HGW-Cloacimonetes-1]
METQSEAIYMILQNSSLAKVMVISTIDLESKSSAMYSRLLNYCRAMNALGVDVHISSMKFSKIFLKQPNKDLITEQFKHKEIRSQSQIYRMLFKEVDLIVTSKYLKQIMKYCEEHEIDRVFVCTENFALTLLALFYSKIYRKIAVIEKNELAIANRVNYQFPDAILARILSVPILMVDSVLMIFRDFAALFYDGVIAISTRLDGVYSRLSNKTIVRIPILCNPNQNSLYDPSCKEQSKSSFDICYAGMITEKKDMLIDLCELMDDEELKSMNCRLHIYGNASKVSAKLLGIGVKKETRFENVFYYGVIPNAELVEKYHSYDLLVMLRKKSMQAQFGFSTKLAEYLMSGVPVLTTDVSDVEMFLDNRKSAYILKCVDYNKENLKTLLKFILKDQNRIGVGLAGKEVALTNFDPLNYLSQFEKVFSLSTGHQCD